MSRPVAVSSGLALLVLALGLWSVAAGAVHVPVPVILNTLFGLDGPRQDFIVWNSRLPRTLLAALTGAALALSGAIVQALLRNPLASPKVIGINSGAALAVCSRCSPAPRRAGSRWPPWPAVPRRRCSSGSARRSAAPRPRGWR